MEKKTTKEKSRKEIISKEMTFAEVMEKHPEAAEIMVRYGLHCIGCHVAYWETIEQGARAHGLSEEQIGEMLAELNRSLGKPKKK